MTLEGSDDEMLDVTNHNSSPAVNPSPKQSLDYPLLKTHLRGGAITKQAGPKKNPAKLKLRPPKKKPKTPSPVSSETDDVSVDDEFQRQINKILDPDASAPEDDFLSRITIANTINAAPHTHTYNSQFLRNLIETSTLPLDPCVHLAHAPCSLLTHHEPPTFLALQRHVQALCVLICLLHPSDPEQWPHRPTIDSKAFPESLKFLNDIYTPWKHEANDKAPVLKVLRNIDLPPPKEASECEFPPCPLRQPPAIRTSAALIEHADQLLTLLDDRFAEEGGLLAVVPVKGAPYYEGAKKTIFGQWIIYTRALTLRLAEYEKELAALRQAMKKHAESVAVRGRENRNQNGQSAVREIVYPQDRYVLAGLSDDLWTAINDALNVREAERRSDLAETGTVRGTGGFGEGQERDDGENITAWIETKSRLYQVRDCQSVFVIPAFDLDPEAPAVRRVERESLVQTVPRIRMDTDGKGGRSSLGQTAYECASESYRNELRRRLEVYGNLVRKLNNQKEDAMRRFRWAKKKIQKLRKQLIDMDEEYEDSGGDPAEGSDSEDYYHGNNNDKYDESGSDASSLKSGWGDDIHSSNHNSNHNSHHSPNHGSNHGSSHNSDSSGDEPPGPDPQNRKIHAASAPIRNLGPKRISKHGSDHISDSSGDEPLGPNREVHAASASIQNLGPKHISKHGFDHISDSSDDKPPGPDPQNREVYGASVPIQGGFNNQPAQTYVSPPPQENPNKDENYLKTFNISANDYETIKRNKAIRDGTEKPFKFFDDREATRKYAKGLQERREQEADDYMLEEQWKEEVRREEEARLKEEKRLDEDEEEEEEEEEGGGELDFEEVEDAEVQEEVDMDEDEEMYVDVDEDEQEQGWRKAGMVGWKIGGGKK